MAEAENAGTEHQRDFDVQPGLDDLATHTQGLHQTVGHQTADQHFPGRFHPKVDHPPPPVLVHGDVGGVEHARQVDARQGDQVEHQHAGDTGATAFGEGRGDVVEEHQHANDDADIRPARRFDVFTSLVDQPDRGMRAGADLHQQIDQHHDDDGQREYPEGQITQFQADDRDTASSSSSQYDRADKAVQQPDDHGIDVHHAVDGKVQDAVQEVRVQELQTGQQAEQDLCTEEHDGDREVLQPPVSGRRSNWSYRVFLLQSSQFS